MQSPILEIRDSKGNTIIKDDLLSIVQRLASYWKASGAPLCILLDGVDVEPPPQKTVHKHTEHCPGDCEG